MKQYPSITGSSGQSFFEFKAHVFDKLDGSNLRMEWNKKKGWYKYGTRHRLFDQTDPIFGPAILLFNNTLANSLEKIIQNQKWKSCVVFCEFWGANSFAGLHFPEDTKHLTLFDISPFNDPMLGPKIFLKLFGHLEIPKYLGYVNWTREFVKNVRNGLVEGITFEGVVGKNKDGKKALMAKAKTQAWIDKVKLKYSQDDAEKIINS